MSFLRLLSILALALQVAATGCEQADRRTTPEAAANPVDTGNSNSFEVTLGVGDARFRPMAFADTALVWGIMRGRLASLRLADGSIEVTRHTAWSVTGSAGVVSWRNELGIWGMRAKGGPRRLAPTQLAPGYDGPPEVLWSPDGTRAVLSWAAEWDYHHDLLHRDGSRSVLATELRGYMLDRAVLWLDSARVLFEVVANAPRAGEPEYRESGWRGDLALLDLRRSLHPPGDDEPDEFRLVTDVADGVFLSAAGLLEGRLLVNQLEAGAVTRHWLYDPGDWARTAIELPGGRAFAAGSTVLVDSAGRLRLLRAGLSGNPGEVIDLGGAAEPATAPTLSTDGSLLVVRVLRRGKNVIVLARRR